MKPPSALIAGLVLGALAACSPTLRAAGPGPGRTWIDPDTGHRVVQLSVRPDTKSLYFTQYAFCDHGGRLVMVDGDGIDLATLETGEVQHVPVGGTFAVVQAGRKTGTIYLVRNGRLCRLDPDSGVTRDIAEIPEHSFVGSINADETLAAGLLTEGRGWSEEEWERTHLTAASVAAKAKGGNLDDFPQKMQMMSERYSEHLPMRLYVIDLKTGERRDLLRTTDWLNHVQFSPTDPGLLSYCHEGPWWLVDRIWLMRVDQPAQSLLVHQRTMRMEIANHEYWSADGQWIWYDLETPMNQVFWVAGYNIRTHQHLWYHIGKDEWSIHYNQSSDGRSFCGDGGEPGHLGPQPEHSKWIYLFRPQPEPAAAAPAANLIQAGTFVTERLVNLSRHRYTLEPNGIFSPDGRWIIFRSNMSGATEVYAVEVKKSAASDR